MQATLDTSGEVVRAQLFQQGLSKANLSIALVRSKKTRAGICTGWFITDRLIVVPDHSLYNTSNSELIEKGSVIPSTVIAEILKKRTRVECYFTDEKNKLVTAEAQVIDVGLSASAMMFPAFRLALLLLDKAAKGHAVTLNLSSVEGLSNFYMLYFNEGNLPLQLGFAQLTGRGGRALDYAPILRGGTEGAAFFSFDGRLIGMQLGGFENEQALALSSIIADLQQSSYWNEIARFHKLPEIKSASQQKKEIQQAAKEVERQKKILHKYAVRWSFHPAKLSATDKKVLSTYIDDESSSTAVMDEGDRIQSIREMGSLRNLRAARGKQVIKDPGQEVIDKILKGPPFNVEKIPEQALPYWLQASAWFEGVVPKLPGRNEISAELQRRRHRSRLVRSAGPDFRGRKKELDTLEAWYENAESGPMIISGIGGIGKSALISKFVLELPKNTLLLWLDFDRADLAPDKAMSVLRILSEQLLFQSGEYTMPDLATQDWESLAIAFGRELKKHSEPALLVLDGFEVAQHSTRYNQIEPLLRILLHEAGKLKIIISGRAKVDKLKFSDKPSQFLSLTGLEETAARQWLVKHGITAPEIVHDTYVKSQGIPLSLKLAVRYIHEGGKISDLPKDYPGLLIDGLLYQRICNRVINQRLRAIVKDLLVLRVISPQLLQSVLFDSMPEKMTPEQVFAAILREMSLVPEVEFVSDNSGNQSQVTLVNIRPEVRAASLRLLELQDAKRVALIDQRAIAFYKKKRKLQDNEKIELLYHYLRTGKVKEAEQLWQQEYAAVLESNVEDIPEKYPDARKWLQSKMTNAPLDVMSVLDWEADAYNRIKALRVRGNLSAIPGILRERSERSAASRLLIYDAWTLWHDQNNAKDALDLLMTASNKPERVSPVVFYEREIVAAKIAYQHGDIEFAKDILQSLASEPEMKGLTKQANVISLASCIMFAVQEQLKKEIELLATVNKNRRESVTLFEALRSFVPPSDLILPELLDQNIRVKNPLALRFKAPVNQQTKKDLIEQLGEVRQFSRAFAPYWQNRLGTNDYYQWVLEEEITYSINDIAVDKTNKEIIIDIALRAWERWHLGLTGNWFDNVFTIADSDNKANIATAFSVAPAFASYRAVSISSSKKNKYLPTFSNAERFVEFMIKKFHSNQSGMPVHVRPESKELALKYVEAAALHKLIPKRLLDWLTGSASQEFRLPLELLLQVNREGISTILFLILMPNPIEVAGNDVLGLPYIFADEKYLFQKRFS